MSTVKIDDLAVGTKVRVTFEGTVTERESTSYPYMRRKIVSLDPVSTPRGLARANNLTPMQVAAAASVEVTAPVWLPGDVVVVRYLGNPTPYTYVRGERDWPGDRRPKSDAEISRLYAEGRAEHVLRNGKPVPPSVVAPF